LYFKALLVPEALLLEENRLLEKLVEAAGEQAFRSSLSTKTSDLMTGS